VRRAGRRVSVFERQELLSGKELEERLQDTETSVQG
jgi:hypothetical protein